MSKEEKPGWGTVTTKVEPNNLVIAGYPLAQLIEHSNVLETAHLLIKTELPSKEELAAHTKAAYEAAMKPAPKVERFDGEDISAALGACLLMDGELFAVPQTSGLAGVDDSATRPSWRSPMVPFSLCCCGSFRAMRSPTGSGSKSIMQA